MHFNTEEELLNYTSGIIGKTFRDLDVNHLLQDDVKDKGILGKIVETGFYKYDNNTKAEADFANLGIELKVTGYVKNKNGTISAKERLVLSKINYNDIISEEFDFSKLLFKNKKILIIWYEYDYKKKIGDFVITNYQLYNMENDSLIIKNDFNIIREKVISGKAHLISEGDTSYLGACVKGINGDERVSQPKSDIPAKPRAFSLKHSYLTGILKQVNSTFALEVDDYEYKTVEEYVFAQIKQYIGKTQIDIYSEIMDNPLDGPVPKNIGKILSDKLIGTDEELPDKSPLFTKTSYKIKNIPVDSNYYPLERMSFRTLKLSDFDGEWEESEWKKFFEEVTIIALCYEGDKDIRNGDRVLKGIKKITFTYDDIESFGLSYNMVKEAINKKDISLLPYPNSYDNQFLEVAPKGAKGSNSYETFFDNDSTKVCFMMNKDFIYSKLIDANETSSDTTNNMLKNQNDNFDRKDKHFNIFELFNYGIKKSDIFILADNRISPYSIYLNGISELEFAEIKANRKNDIVRAVKEMVDNNDYNRNIYELLYQGISGQLCDSLIDKKITIETLQNNDINTLKDLYDVGNSTANKLKGAIECNDIVIIESEKNISTVSRMEEVLRKLTLDNPISSFDFYQVLKKDDSYIIEHYDSDFEKLKMKDVIEFSSFGIKYKVISFIDYISSFLSVKQVDIIIRRSEGNTLEAIAKDFEVTRERIRQVEAKTWKKISDNIKNVSFLENKYISIFKKYTWDKELFCDVFKEKPITYDYLLRFYTKSINWGNNIEEAITDESFTIEQKNILKNKLNIAVTDDGQTLRNENEFLYSFVCNIAQDEITVDDFMELYNNEIKKFPELNLQPFTSRNLEAKLSRCDYVIFGSNHKIRYYDFEKLSGDEVEQLKELIIINDGFYSTEYLFRNNIKLMKELDIRNECELHNILKNKIDDDENNVYFIRMPNFLVEYKDKDEFILDKIKEFSPISLNDFIDMLNEDYGHKKNTMMAYLTTYFSEFFSNGNFSIESQKLNENQIDELKATFIDDIYSIDSVNNILKNKGYSDPDDIITNYNFGCIGFRLKSGFIIKKIYSGIYDYLDSKIKKQDMIRFDDALIHCGTIYNAVNSYCRNYQLFRMTDNVFVTKNKLIQLGISEEFFNKFIIELRNTYIDKDYFSINNVVNDIDCDLFFDIGLNDEFLDNLIFSMEDITTLRINNYRLFSYNKENVSIKIFMEDMINKYNSISLNDLEDEIKKNYMIDISSTKLREYLYRTDIFYSDIMEKIYLDKKDYYEEVYNE